MAFMNGVARGIVTNSDSSGRGRVQVRLPAVAIGSDLWAPCCVANPRVGDEVIVAFEHGDIDRPVVLGRVGG